MTPEQLSYLLRSYLLQAEKRSALVFLSHFDRIREDLTEYLIRNGVDSSSINGILDDLERQIATRTVRFSGIVSDAQRYVVRQTAGTLNLYVKAKIFSPDREAIRILIGRTQDGGPLTRIFDRLSVAVRENVRLSLIDGLENGLGARAVASRISSESDIGLARALTISRTETNEAYRAASREFYSGAGIKKYVWMAVLDARTCIICWTLHGRIFDSEKKVFSHPNCRCTVIPVTKTMPGVETGESRFAKIEPGWQKQILGPARYELYKSGTGLSSFVGARVGENASLDSFIKPLSEFE